MKLVIVLLSLGLFLAFSGRAEEPPVAEPRGEYEQNRGRIQACGRQHDECLTSGDYTLCAEQLQNCVESFSLQNPSNESVDIWAAGGP